LFHSFVCGVFLFLPFISAGKLHLTVAFSVRCINQSVVYCALLNSENHSIVKKVSLLSLLVTLKSHIDLEEQPRNCINCYKSFIYHALLKLQ